MADPKPRTLRARSTIFRRTEEGIPEIEEAAQQASQPTKRQRIKATFYLEPEDILALDHLQSEEFRHTGKKPERSVLVSRAIQAFLKGYQDGQPSANGTA